MGARELRENEYDTYECNWVLYINFLYIKILEIVLQNPNIKKYSYSIQQLAIVIYIVH